MNDSNRRLPASSVCAILVTIACGLTACGLPFLAGCKPKANDPAATDGKSAATPTFSLAWSEYPSWSVFGVADELGLINGAAGEMGELEKKFNIDIELKEAVYEACLNMYTSRDCDAVCITNMDALIASPSRSGVAVLATSTSNGADACVVSKEITNIEDLKDKKVFGLKGTVSEYCFVRCIEKAGFDEKDFQFTNQEPATAAQNMQQSAESHQAIMVWNPFVLQTLNDREDTHVLFDSSEIKGEIVDMVVVGSDILELPGATEFIQAINETFYSVNAALAEPESGDEVLVALGKKFSRLGLEDMKTVVQQTEFFKTPAESIEILDGEAFKTIMESVSDFCVTHELIKNPSIGYGADAAGANLRFDSQYLK